MYNPNEPRDNAGKWTDSGISDSIMAKMKPGLQEELKYNPTGKLTVAKIKKIKPEDFYKYEYLSKNTEEWKPILKTDSPLRLHNSGYEIRIKELYRYTQ